MAIDSALSAAFDALPLLLDGDIENHNKVRFIGSNKKKGSFYTIVNNINSLVKSPKLFVSLRINYIKNSLFSDKASTFRQSRSENVQSP